MNDRHTFTPPTFYIVVTEFEHVGFGSQNDATPSRDQAFSNFIDCISDGQPSRAFRIDLDFESGEIEFASEVTSDFQAELEYPITYRAELSLQGV